MSAMRGGTLFSGIGAPECAMPWVDWRWAAEIDPFASAVHAARFPGVPNLGDVTRIDPDAVEHVDLVVFGSPCQSFSVAGKRLGLDDPRGNLALIALQLIGRVRPRWVVFENVPGLLSSDGGRDFGAFLGLLGECGYGFAYRVLDAQYAGVPQRRRRVFVVAYLGDWRPPAAVLFEPESLRGDSAPRRAAGERVAWPVASSPEGGSGYRNDADPAENLIAFQANAGREFTSDEDRSPPLRSAGAGGMASVAIAFNNAGHGWWNNAEVATGLRDMSAGSGSKEETLVAFGGNRQSGPIDVATAVNAHGGPHGRQDFESETFVTHSLRADGFDASEDGTGRGTPLTLAIRGRGNSHDLEWRDDGTANAILTPNGGRGGIGVGAVAFHENQRAEVTFNETAGSLKVGGGKPGQGYPAVAYEGTSSHVDSSQTRSIETLRALRSAVDEEALARWCLGILAPFWPQEVLQPKVHGSGIRCSSQPQRGLLNVSLSCAKTGSRWSVLDLWQAGSDGCPPQGWRPSEQLAGELGAYLSLLPYSPSPAERFLRDMRAASEGTRLLQQTLVAVEAARRSACGERQPVRAGEAGRGEQPETPVRHAGMPGAVSCERILQPSCAACAPRQAGLSIRRLCVEECEALQGLPRSWTAIQYRGKPAADGPRYRAIGNSMAVPVVAWIGHRIRLFEEVTARPSAKGRTA